MKPLFQKTYLTTLKASLGSELFQHFYVEEKDEVIDVLQGGTLSCAYFVSCILKRFNWIPEIHTTVKGTVAAMEKVGWIKVHQNELKEGDVLVWEEIEYDDGSRHGHIGFYVGQEKAISHSAYEKVPVEHHFTFGGKRIITKVLRYQP